MSETPAPTLLSLLDRWRQNQRNQPAIVEYDVHASKKVGKPILRHSLTADELWNKVIYVAAYLRHNGIGRGSVVAVQLPTWHEYVVAHLAAYAIGAVTAPVSTIYRVRDLGRQLFLSRAKALLVPASYGSFDFCAMAEGLKREVDSLQMVIAVGDGAPAGALTWEHVLQCGAAEPCSAEHQAIREGRYAHMPNDLMLLNFSSGTTGEPKGIMHSTQSVLAAVSAAAARLELTRDDVVFIAVTLGHAAGYLNGIYMPLLLGAKVVYMDLWDPTIALHVLEAEKVTYGPAMPAYLFDLADHPRFSQANLGHWKTARVSGGAIARPLMASLQERLPHLRLCPGWGLSEVLYATCGSPGDSPEKRNKTEGRPLNGYQINIRDSTFKNECQLGVTGEIVIKSPSLMLGYFNNEALTRQAFTEDGWLKTGDLGFLDADGYLTMVGRSKELIIRGGENIPIVEVEQLLREHEKVGDVALIGVPDARLGEKVCAVIIGKSTSEPLSFEEMKSYLIRRQLTNQFIPEYLVLVDEMPRTAVGKVKKQELRKQVLDNTPQFADVASAPNIKGATILSPINARTTPDR